MTDLITDLTDDDMRTVWTTQSRTEEGDADGTDTGGDADGSDAGGDADGTDTGGDADGTDA